MARNAEKAMTALARWRAAHVDPVKDERRPYLASECEDRQKAEKWRRQVIGEISKKVAQIQNAGLGEFKLRDLNDEINKLLREKRHWEVRIVELGGPNYYSSAPKMIDQDGKEVPGNRGYKYFGAAKELPGVKELFEQEPPKQIKKTRAQLMKRVDADYYGCRDDDDGLLIPSEEEVEERERQRLIDEWTSAKEAGLTSSTSSSSAKVEEEESIYSSAADETETDDRLSEMLKPQQAELLNTDEQFIAHVPVPSQAEIENALVQRKKRELLEKYVGEET